ncbi:MAG: hypothetical protein GY756_26970 [bacterium]|nr:hypothetical protein [bacterium]
MIPENKNIKYKKHLILIKGIAYKGFSFKITMPDKSNICYWCKGRFWKTKDLALKAAKSIIDEINATHINKIKKVRMPSRKIKRVKK